MRAIKTTTISILATGLLAGSAVGVAAQEETTDPPTSEVVNGFFSSFDDDGTDLEVPEFVITFPDGGEAVVQGIFTITGSFPNSASGDDTVTISGDGWELTGVVTMNASHILEYYGSSE